MSSFLNSIARHKPPQQVNEKDTPKERSLKINEISRQTSNRLSDLERKIVELENRIEELE